MIDKEEELRSKSHGVYKSYTNSFWNEIKDRVHISDIDYTNGCCKNGWISMVDIYPILVHKYGDFNLIVLSGQGKPYLYDIKLCSDGLLKGLAKCKWIESFLNPSRKFLKNTMITYFDANHYQDVLMK